MSTLGDSNSNHNNTFQITKTQLYVPIVTLNAKDNEELNELLSKGFKRSVFWNEYKSTLGTYTADNNNLKKNNFRFFI